MESIVIQAKLQAWKKLNILVMVEDIHKTQLFLAWLPKQQFLESSTELLKRLQSEKSGV